MKWSSAVSESPSLSDALEECGNAVRAGLGDLSPDLIVAFPSPHYAAEYEGLPELVRDRVGPGLLVGCSGGGVIGAGREVEHRAGFALTAAVLPDVELTPFHVGNDALPDEDAAPDRWQALVGTTTEEGPQFVILADPMSMRIDKLVVGLDYAFPGSPKIGGMASGGPQPGTNALFLGDTTHRSGAVGVAMTGAVAVDTIVAQGCRPIGDPMLVTSCSRNVLVELDGHGALEVVRQVYDSLNEADQLLVRKNSLFLGVVMDGLNDSPEPGDFLIRNVLGADEERGALAVGEVLREGQIVQFHVRDARTSAQDLEAMLTGYDGRHSEQDEMGALLFSCLGRGSYLYGRADHDTDMFRDVVGSMPLTGFFCNGEIGPVGDTTYVHGYTSSFGIFRPR